MRNFLSISLLLFINVFIAIPISNAKSISIYSVDAKSKKNIASNIKLMNLSNHDVSMLISENGIFDLDIPYNTKFLAVALVDGYLPSFSIFNSSSLPHHNELVIPLFLIAHNTLLSSDEVKFKDNSASFDGFSSIYLSAIRDFLRKNPRVALDITLFLHENISNNGMMLGEKRIANIANYFKANKIDSRRLSINLRVQRANAVKLNSNTAIEKYHLLQFVVK